MDGFLALMNSSETDINKLRGAIENCDGASESMEETIVQPVGHFSEIFGNEMIFFLQLLFVKRIERESVKRTVHQDLPLTLE